MPECRITVLKRAFFKELADEYCGWDTVGPCEQFTEGQEFVVERDGPCPDGFCDWAWNDINKVLVALMAGGSFEMWMKDGNTNITCCTDGIRPVVFKLERIGD